MSIITPPGVRRTGDTMTGPLVLPGDPTTGLQAATKNYADLMLPKTGGTVSGNVVVTGTHAVQGTLTLGAGSTGGQAIAASGTGNFTVTLGGSSSLLNFRASGGTSILQVGGSTNTVAVQTQLTLPTTKVWTGAAEVSNASLYSNTAWTGTPGGNIFAGLAFLQTSENIQVGIAGQVVALNVHNTSTAGFTGQRHAAQFTQDVTGTSANTETGGGSYTAINCAVNLLVNDGGTALDATNSKGTIFAFNPVAHVGPSATFLNGVVGQEVDVWCEDGSSMFNRIGFSVVDTASAGSGYGTQDDQAISIGNGYVPGSGPGWKVGIGIGRLGGNFPIAATGTIFAVVPRAGTGPATCAKGIDFTAGTFTTSAIATPGFKVDGSGYVFPLVQNAANDAAAATAGVPVGALYRNGNAVQVRLV